jgi:hypothetical protein
MECHLAAAAALLLLLLLLLAGVCPVLIRGGSSYGAALLCVSPDVHQRTPPCHVTADMPAALSILLRPHRLLSLLKLYVPATAAGTAPVLP